MLLEIVIGLCLLLYLVWKYWLTSKNEQIKSETSQPVQEVKPVQKTTEIQNLSENVESATNQNGLVNKEVNIKNFDISIETKQQSDRNQNLLENFSNKVDKLITPSILLKLQNEKNVNENLAKRESPPKERLAEFLEKTIFSDDKIQSIIQNLSLDKTEILIHEEPAKVLYATSKDITPHEKVEEHILSETAIKQHDTIEKIADRIKKLNIKNIGTKLEEHKLLSEEPIVKNIEEDKPFLKRLQKQPGFPPGLNFGSVIGELKNKTKNGGLKPVFKKFDTDTVDNKQESLNAAVDEKKKVQIEENEISNGNMLAERRNKLETAAQGWRKRVPQNDASLFTVAGRLERDKVVGSSPPLTPPSTPGTTVVASPGIPPPNTFRSRKQTSPTNGFASGPHRSASCAVVNVAVTDSKPKETARIDRESFKRSHSVSESFSRAEAKEESSSAERSGQAVQVPRADDETFHAFFTPALQQERTAETEGVDVDLDAIDSGSRQM